MCAGEVERVVRRLEQRDRLAHVRERDRRAALLVREPRDRPVEPDAHVRVLGLLRALERVLHDLLRAREVAGVAERVAEERRVPHRGRGVAARRLDLREAALEQLDRLVGAADAGVRAAELRVDVEAVDGRERLVLERGLEQVDRVD